MPKIVYQTDANGVFVGLAEADPSPLEPGVWLIPGGCVEVPPPTPPSGSVARWQNGEWEVVSDDVSDVPQEDLTPERIVATYSAAVDARVEARARQLNYNGAAHLASYVTSSVESWAAEAQAFVEWRDSVWLHVLSVYAAVQAEEQAMPTLQELLDGLPTPV